jgi:cell division protein FtsI/penicillin-binding protein 2
MLDTDARTRLAANVARSSSLPARVAAIGALAVVVGAVAFVLFGGAGKAAGPSSALDPYLAAWSRGDDRGAGALTDDPRAATAALIANRRGLDGARVQTAVGQVREDRDSADADVRVTWDVPGIGQWSYRTTVALAHDNGKWRVSWTPADIHPRLRGATRLGTVREASPRAPILDRDGRPLMMARQVVRVGIDRAKVRDVDATAQQLGTVLKIDGDKLAEAARRAGPKQFVEAITLRTADYQPLAERLKAIQGVQTVDGTAQLAPSRSFARALLGAVGPATAEQVAQSHGVVAAGDEVGQWGLEARFESRLAGTATRRIVIRNAAGTPVTTLLRREGKKGQALRTTLDRDVQQAAETALGPRRDKAAVVALQPSTGDILAVANRPSDQTFDRAIDGRYPPGSTFKVVSTAALLRDGLKVTDTVECPKTITVGGKEFRNFEGEAAGAVPFSTDFAQSCNTAFVSLAKRLPADAVTRVARDFGLGRTRASEVPPGTDPVERAAAMIGQARIVASPLAMAGVAATVADGRWHVPRLVSTDPHSSGPSLAAGEVTTLRTLMRSVVTSGTGTALAVVPGEVAGKTGTAEFGGGNPPPTHAWFIAFRGDLAVAVLVEKGSSGGAAAAPVAQRFFQALPAEVQQ